MKAEDLLQGAYDIHIHCGPDLIPRKQDVVDLAKAAHEAGMAGILVKDHTTSTVGRVHAVNRMMAGKTRLFSCIALNPPVGSLNPTAVEAALREGADLVYFPTYGARNHIAIWGAGKPPTAFPLPGEGFQGLSILDDQGQLKPECETILDMIAAFDAVLATGHLSPEESLLLLAAAGKQGVKRMVVNHASMQVTDMTVDQQREAADLGGFLEHSFFAVTKSCPGTIPLEKIRDQVLQVGVEHCIISTDFGQAANPAPVDGFKIYLEELRKLGLTDDELRVMVVDNPAKLLENRKVKS